jgi:hypothetical protein
VDKVARDKLLRYSFAEEELSFLKKDPQFVERCETVANTEDFDRLFNFGYRLLVKNNKVTQL